MTRAQAGDEIASVRLGRRRSRAPLLVLPALVVLALFMYYPVVGMLGRSFDGGLVNYQWVFESTAARRVFAVTFGTAAIVTVVSVVLGYPYAYVMTIVGPKMRIGLMAAVLIPFWTSSMIRTFAWIIILQTTGLLNRLLALVGVEPLGLLGTTVAVTIGMAQILMPFAVLPMYAVLTRLDRKLPLAAQSLGARPLVAFFRVYFPLSLPGVASGAILVFVLSLGFFVTPALLGSPGNTMIAVLIQAQVGEVLDWGRGGALAGTLLLITILIMAAAGWVAMRMRKPGQGGEA